MQGGSKIEIIIYFVIIWPFAGAFFTWLLSFVKGNLGDKARKVSASVTVTLQMLSMAFLCYYAFKEGQAFDTTMLDGLKSTETAATLEVIFGPQLIFAVDRFRVIYSLIITFVWFVSTLFSFDYMNHFENQNRYFFFFLVILGATTGVFLSADLITMCVFLEIMSLASYVWVARDERSNSLRTEETCLAIAVVGGFCILMGLFFLYGISDQESNRKLAASILLLIGFGAKAAAVPLYIWLPKDRPTVPVPVSALLSGILTKTGIFGIMLLLLQMFYGNQKFGVVIYLVGILTIVAGAASALFSINLKRILAYSSVSQIGFILTGLGLAGMFSSVKVEQGLTSAFHGALLQMVNQALTMLLLFGVGGVVFMNLYKLNLNDMRGFGRKKPLLHILFISGALGLTGVPLFNGYVSKSLIHEGVLLWQQMFPSVWMKATEWLFVISAGLTAAYMTKLYIVLFWDKNVDADCQDTYDQKSRYMGKASAILFTIMAVLIPVLGIITGIYLDMFHFESLMGSLTSLAIGFLIYMLIIRRWGIKVDDLR